MSANWRVIKTNPFNGAMNMALDEAILESVGKRNSPPTLRLYAWEPACLSLGYAQPISDIDTDTLESLHWDIVRRPTGGRAILHVDELTYAIIAHKDEPEVEGGILDSYRRLSKGLLKSLEILNLPANADKEYDLPVGANKNAPVCFEVPSNYEITVGGRKIIGSAQARRLDGVLQHGSLPLFGDLTRITKVLNVSDSKNRQLIAEKLLQRAATVEMILGKRIAWEEATEAFITGFSQALCLNFFQSEPSPEELHRAGQLIEEKYTHPSWLHRL